MELIFKQFIETQSTLKVARFLNDLGSKNRQNKSWDCRRILDILQNPTYKGDLKWSGKLFPGTHLPIISAQTFEYTQQFLKKRGSLTKTEAVLQKLLYCGHCSVPMTPSYSFNPQKIRYYYYLCTSSSTNKAGAVSSCPKKRVPLTEIQDAVISYICSLAQEFAFDSLANRIGKHNSGISFQEKEMASAVGVLQDELQKLKSKKDRFFDTLMTHSLLSHERKMGTERLQELDVEERNLKAQLHKQEFEKTALAETKIDIVYFRQSLDFFAQHHSSWNPQRFHAELQKLIQDIYRNAETLTIRFKLLPWPLDVPFKQAVPP